MLTVSSTGTTPKQEARIAMNGQEKSHPFHRVIGKTIIGARRASFPDCRVVGDPACGGRHRIPLFLCDRKSRRTQYCNVDLLIVQPESTQTHRSEKIRVIIEIEEADVTPIQIFGKFLASALSSFYIYREEQAEMANSVLFVQILDESRSRDEESKREQWNNIAKSITEVIPIKGSRINGYRLFSGKCHEFERDGKQAPRLVNEIRRFVAGEC